MEDQAKTKEQLIDELKKKDEDQKAIIYMNSKQRKLNMLERAREGDTLNSRFISTLKLAVFFEIQFGKPICGIEDPIPRLKGFLPFEPAH